MIFFNNVMEIASFDFVDIDESVHNVLKIDPTGAVQVKYQLIGFESEYWIVNSGTMFLIYIIYLVLLLFIYPVVRLCHKNVRNCQAFKQKLRQKVMWSSLVTLMNESYMIVVVCLLINVYYLSFETIGLAVMSILCKVFLLTSIALPFGLSVHMLCNFS